MAQHHDLSNHRGQKGLVSQELILTVDKMGIWSLIYLVHPTLSESFASVVNICNIPFGMHIMYTYLVHNLSCSLMERVESCSSLMSIGAGYGRTSLRDKWYREGSVSLCERLGFKSQPCLVQIMQAHYTYSASWNSVSHLSA